VENQQFGVSLVLVSGTSIAEMATRRRSWSYRLEYIAQAFAFVKTGTAKQLKFLNLFQP